jgi:hypothetical protein
LLFFLAMVSAWSWFCGDMASCRARVKKESCE